MRHLYLALDATTEIASVAIGGPGTTPVERVLRGGPREHGAALLPAAAALLADVGLETRALAGIVVGDGPGSFTGLRVAAASAKGLLHGLGRPLFAVPSLFGCAHRTARLREEHGPVAAAFDALRGEVFAARYLGNRVLTAPTVVRAPDMASLGPARLAAGDGATRYAEVIRAWTGRAPVGPPVGRASAAALLEAVSADPLTFRVADLDTWEPAYGRPAEAQARWEARHGRPLPHPSGTSR